MQQYARAARELLDKAAKLTIRQPGDATSADAGDADGLVLEAVPPRSAQPRPLAALVLPQLPAASSPVAARPGLPVEARVSRFKQELLASRINLAELRRLSFQGIPDRDGLRAMTWKLLLGYLPPDPSEWDEMLARKRTEYLMFCEDLIVDPKKQQQQAQQQRQQQQQQQQALGAASLGAAPAAGSSEPGTEPGSSASSGGGAAAGSSGGSSNGGGAAALDPLTASSGASSSGRDQPAASSAAMDPLSAPSSRSAEQLKADVPEDHPLSLQSSSKWHTFFKDNEIMEQIDRDVMRTHPDMHFFSGDSRDAEQHRREMKRCLFMYAKLNPGLRYIQGMNELLAPLYYMFATDPDRTSARYAEADAFYCFVDLISEFRDHFCQQLDNSASGIRATISKLMTLLQAQDVQLAEHLQKHKVDPQFFAFRWITLLLTQEFPFPDAVRIWDTLLSDPGGRLDCLLRVCLTLLLNVREQLLAGDFAVIVKTLQRYPAVDVDVILRAAARLPPCASVLGAPP